MTDAADEAVALANRLNDVMRELSPNTQPGVVITALCAMLGRAIDMLEQDEKEKAYDWAASLIRIGGGIGSPN